MPTHDYRVTVDALHPSLGEEGLQSLSFFASTHNDIFATANSLRARLDCSACHATKLAVGLSLLSQFMREDARLAPFLESLPEPLREVSTSLQSVAAQAGA